MGISLQIEIITNELNGNFKRHYIQMKQFLIITSALLISFQAQTQTVKIAAAANLRYVLDELKTAYTTKNAGVQIDISYGASGALTQQIINGAGYNIFMAADKTFPDKLKEMGYTSGEVKTYAYGKIVIWSNSVDVSKGLEILADKSVHKIAVAKPDIAPYGDRAVECLKYYKMFDNIKDKIVYADNISQAAQFAQTGNAEVGFIALSIAMAPEMKGTYFIIDTKSYKPVEQTMVLVKGWEANPEAAKFMKFLLGAECKPVFEKYGYIVP
jgi:molybdate transport system substrate-binding protein